MAHKSGWSTLRVDGRGYQGQSSSGELLDATELLMAMDYSYKYKNNLLDKHPRVCFIGHPQAGGYALTLTASPTALFYSNSFDGTGRMQAIERGHRIGMNINKGYRIIDIIHLPTDQLVLDNLEKKIRLQDISMGKIEEALEKFKLD